MQEKIKTNKLTDIFGEVIFSYTRKQAIKDGVLVDVSKMACEAGIRYPVAVTQAIWTKYIVPSVSLKKQGQSIKGRLWDLLYMFQGPARSTPTNVMLFDLYFLMEDGENNTQNTRVTMKAVCGPGDAGEPVITIMRRNED